MKIFCFVALLLAPILALQGCGGEEKPERPGGAEIRISWGVVDNLTEGGFESELTLLNQGDTPLPDTGWSLYFNFARWIQPESFPSEVRIEQINGDFYRLTPEPAFAPIDPGASLSIAFVSDAWVINESEAPSGFYFVFEGERPETVTRVDVLPFETRSQTRRTPEDQLPVPTPASRFQRNADLTRIAEEELPQVIPSPAFVRPRSGSVELSSAVQIYFPGPLQAEAGYLASALERLFGSRPNLVEAEAPPSGPASVRLRLEGFQPVLQSSHLDEGYQLHIEADQGVEIRAGEPAGIFYGIQTLLARLPVDAYRGGLNSVSLEAVLIQDWPRFGYRGVHLDVARNFQETDTVKRFLDLFAFYKLNRFHFHLTDDEGWRLEIPGLPELTEVGSRRGHTLEEEEHLVPSFGSGPSPEPGASSGSGHYTREEFIEILRHAAERHIEVIPEIDFPGHARAAIRSMEVRYNHLMAQGQEEEAERYLLSDLQDRSDYRSVQGWTDNVVNVCRDSTYRFIEKVVDEIQDMYQEAGVPLSTIHTGGDEVPEGVWTDSPRCRAFVGSSSSVASMEELPGYFLQRVEQIFSDRGLTLSGWEEVGLIESEEEGEAIKAPNPAFVDDEFRLYAWNSVWGWGGEENAYRLANAGYPVVLCNASNLYFDLAYSKDPEEIGYYWAGFVDTRAVWEFAPLNLYLGAELDLMGNPLPPDRYRDAERLTRQGAGNILGIQGQLWSENIKSVQVLEYLALPKLIALTERAWSPADPWESAANPEQASARQADDWNLFANTLGQRDLPRLDYFLGGFRYRLPLPGARWDGERLTANVEFPGLEIRYTTDGSDPTPASSLYTGPVEAEGLVKLRTFDSRGRGSRISILVPDNQASASE